MHLPLRLIFRHKHQVQKDSERTYLNGRKKLSDHLCKSFYHLWIINANKISQ